MHTNKVDPLKQSWLTKFKGLCQKTLNGLSPVILGLLTVYLSLRIAFVFYHEDKLQGISALEWVYLFLNGFRFDLAALTPFFLLFFLVTLVPFSQLKRWLWWGTTGFALLFVLLNGADLVLIGFTGRRFTKSSLVLVGEGNWKNLLDFALISLFVFLFLLVSFFSARWSFKLLMTKQPEKNYSGNVALAFLVLILSVIFVRGGLQLKPISFVDAKIVEHPFAHQVVLNTTFTFLTSLGKKGLQKEVFFSRDEMHSYLNLNPNYYFPAKSEFNFTDFNIVFFILEGFSSEYFSAQTTPFLFNLSQGQNAAFFDKAYANGRRSIEGIAALFAGIPALMESPFINSEYATNKFIGLGQLFKNKNYHTSFFHGAVNGSMRFDQFTHSTGFDHYFGKNEFPDQSKDDGTWGIYDEPFLIWTCEKQSKFKTPFLSSIFTLSSHHPFNVPDEYKNIRPAQTNIERTIRSFQYSDWAVQRYFECAKKKPWFKKTLFVFVGDHTGPSLKPNPSMPELFHITLGFYTSDVNLKSMIPTNQYAQQIDLLPTLSDLFDLGPLPPNHLSRSLLKTGKKSIALFSDQNWQIVGDAPDLDKSLKAIKQYFSEAMVDNRLYYPSVR